MEDLLKAGDYNALAEHCEQEELKVCTHALPPRVACETNQPSVGIFMIGVKNLDGRVSALSDHVVAPNGVASAEVYSTLLGVYLLQNELDHAKLLWQRIPKSVKQSNGEIPELWEIGKRLWRRDFAAIYELARNPSWPRHLAPLVASLVERVRQRVIALVGKAYSTIRVSELCTLLGKSEADVRQIAEERGWELDEQNNVFRPKLPPAPEAAAVVDHHERLQRLTDIISFLEN